MAILQMAHQSVGSNCARVEKRLEVSHSCTSESVLCSAARAGVAVVYENNCHHHATICLRALVILFQVMCLNISEATVV